VHGFLTVSGACRWLESGSWSARVLGNGARSGPFFGRSTFRRRLGGGRRQNPAAGGAEEVVVF
jgi:hypothetical protein